MSELLVTTHQQKPPMTTGRWCAQCVRTHTCIKHTTAAAASSLLTSGDSSYTQKREIVTSLTGGCSIHSI